jgi:epoxide hydrolase-like predicted phosphatase
MAEPAHHLIKAVVWDLGGVLARTLDSAPRTELARRLSINYTELDEAVFNSPSARQATLGEISTNEHWANVYRSLNWPVEQRDVFQELFWGGDRLDQELVAYIRRLKPAFKTGLLSNNWPNLRDLIENRWQIADAFDELIISAEVGLKKPEQPIYDLTLQRLGFRPEQAVFVDDFIENIHAAQQLGWQAVHFQNPDQALAELNALLEIPAERSSSGE